MITSRTLYYSQAININSIHFDRYRSYASNKVFGMIKCWPLKIELRSDIIPCLFTIEAVEIIPKKLSESRVLLPPDKPIKRLPLF
jgi:hypothetical protein